MDIHIVSPLLSAVLIGVAVVLSAAAWRSPLDTLRRTLLEEAWDAKETSGQEVVRPLEREVARLYGLLNDGHRN